ncbi:unnamed protein product [Ophioblennius macclurei]
MESLSTRLLEDSSFLKDEEEEDDWDEEEDEVNSADSLTEEEETVQKQKKPNWAPQFFQYAGKEVYNYVDQRIVIEEAFDSFAGMIWPAALALCRYLDTHREEVNLVDKSVLEIGAGTGLVSIVAALLGGWVTATDLPEVLGNLRVNLLRNTKGQCRYTPQVAVLSWGYDLEKTYPSSVYHYDYVLAADVVYHHDYLEELLVTMKHFCKPGTTLIWANKVRFKTDLTFTDNFEKAFKTSLLAEDGDMKIFMATSRGEEEEEGGVGQGIHHHPLTVEEDEKEDDDDEDEKSKEEQEQNETEMNGEKEKETEEEENLKCDGEEKMKEAVHDDDDDDDDSDTKDDSASSDESGTGQESAEDTIVAPTWTPSLFRSYNQDMYHYAGQNILIHESIDSFGAVMWPAALALCSFLEKNKKTVNLEGKEVLELGAGTGLVTIVASLLGARVTATDLPDILSNLLANVMRNTRGRCRHTPQVEVLSWGYDLERTHPSSVYCYDYVLAADVVYHHDYLQELLATMKHFCGPGTTLIWANKVRFKTDLTFTENFKKTFNTRLVAEDGEMKIFMATSKETHRETRRRRNY